MIGLLICGACWGTWRSLTGRRDEPAVLRFPGFPRAPYSGPFLGKGTAFRARMRALFNAINAMPPKADKQFVSVAGLRFRSDAPNLAQAANDGQLGRGQMGLGLSALTEQVLPRPCIAFVFGLRRFASPSRSLTSFGR